MAHAGFTKCYWGTAGHTGPGSYYRYKTLVGFADKCKYATWLVETPWMPWMSTKKDIITCQSVSITSLTYIKSYTVVNFIFLFRNIQNTSTVYFSFLNNTKRRPHNKNCQTATKNEHERNKALHYGWCFCICQRCAQQRPQGARGAGRKTILKGNGNGWFLFQVGDTVGGKNPANQLIW